ncbi:MAG TPA: hypothetical protein VFV38_10300 [Ktedonobacteraceae bacterium]|nr:hypothetical protein [Ktedonobacteraceae bacterium]
MKKITSFAELPEEPAIYALYGGQGKTLYVAYVGQAGQLKSRITQHLVRRDSSIATGASVVSLNPDKVTQVAWWGHPHFEQPAMLTAAESVAFDVLDPVLRSRLAAQKSSRPFYEDEQFYAEMKALFAGEPHGCLALPTFREAILRIATLEEQVADLQRRVLELEKGRGKL